MAEQKHYSAACAQTTGRVISARILPDLDILDTIEEICMEYGIRYGQISTCIGSLRSFSCNFVSTPVPAGEHGYTTHLEMAGAFSILSGMGLVSPADEEGHLNTHLHFVVSGQNDAVYGGHVERGTRTLTTTDLFITELTGIEIHRAKDPQTGAVTTTFKEAKD